MNIIEIKNKGLSLVEKFYSSSIYDTIQKLKNILYDQK